MTTYDWPASLRPQAFEAQLVPNVRGFSSAYGGSTQVLDLLGERWEFEVTLPPCARADAGQREAFFARLKGGANRAALWHMGRPVPVGTLRGVPVLATAAAQGSSSLALANCSRGNLLPNSGFQALSTTSGTGIESWASYNNGNTAVTYEVSAGGGVFGTNFLRVVAVAATTQTLGIYTSSAIFITGGVTTWTPGATYTLSFWARASSASAVGVSMTALPSNMGWSFASTVSQPTLANGEWRQFIFRVKPADNAVTPLGEFYVSWEVVGTLPAGATYDICAVQVEHGSSAGDYLGGATIQAGDMLKCGGQIFMAAETATAGADDKMTVAVTNRARSIVAAGSVVAWYRPTAEFILMDTSGVPVRHDIGVSQPITVRLREVW